MFLSPFFPVLLVVTEKGVCREYVQFHEKKACFVVLNQRFLKVLTFQTGDFDSDISPVLVDEKIFYPGECCNTSQGWDFSTRRPPTDVPAVFSLCSIQRERKRMISRKSILGYLLPRKER